ncbi:hypothetical protein MXD62_28205 [Frankia sp. Mgl5]|uniref:hypothetical protein n=1 Tax=Frankia sp. Mgl5 TaxID=2933793 RepID=UPI00200F1320|nr:hypothetical protein [Frankia sp. Mgl5]MCK9930980.1 hypothetical protein [Frankia sp. Mgl5]
MAATVRKRLRRWLHRTAVTAEEAGERDHLSGLVTAGRVAAAAGGTDPGVGPTEFAGALLTVARDGDPALRQAVLDALGTAAAPWWLAVDTALRQRWWSTSHWSRRLAADLADGEVDELRLVVAGCHHNGRIREAAAVRLADRTHPAAAAVLALRACDWVAEVRHQARTAVEGWPALPDGPALTTLAELAFALRGRREGTWLAQRVDQILRDLPARQLQPLLSARDRATRRAAYRAAIATDQLSLDQLTTAAVRDGDLPIRTMCAQAAVRATADPAQLHAMLASRTAQVRAEALQALIARGDSAVAEAALADRHPLVRETAQAALRRAGSDPAERYRRLAAAQAPEPGAIAGLGETGAADDADVVARWLSHPRARGRVEAIRALRRLGVTRTAELVPMLRDDSAAVTRQAVATLRRESGAVERPVLEALLAAGNAPHVRFAGYRLLTTGDDAWQRMAVNLRLLDDAYERLRANAQADLTAWLDNEAATTYHAPSRDRAAELDSLIERTRPVLGEHRARLLRFHAGLETAD